MQAFECHGLWYLPNTETPPAAGTLRVSADGELRLFVMGSLGSSKAPLEVKEHAVILGSVDGRLGNNVTLARCYVTRSQFGSFACLREE
jgi:hypothetical protein